MHSELHPTVCETVSNPFVPGLAEWLDALCAVDDALGCEPLARLAAAAPAALGEAPGLPQTASERSYRRLILTGSIEAWLIRWCREHDTGFHDHDRSAGAVQVLAGALVEESLTLLDGPAQRRYGCGRTFSFDASHIHRMRHADGDVAVSVHLYSPPLLRMGCYDVGSDGLLRRHSVPSDTELRPTLAAAAAA